MYYFLALLWRNTLPSDGYDADVWTVGEVKLLDWLVSGKTVVDTGVVSVKMLSKTKITQMVLVIYKHWDFYFQSVF